MGFAVVRATPFGFFVIVPHWFLVLLTGALAALPWIKRPYRFSFRTLLIAMTVLAVFLGINAFLN
jgi:hypothetical protein